MFLGSRLEIYIERRDKHAALVLEPGKGRRYKRMPGEDRRHQLIQISARYQIHIVHRGPPGMTVREMLSRHDQ